MFVCRMDLFDAIAARRSFRRFSKQEVPAKVVREILELALFAPSAGDARPWHFLVVEEREMLDAAARINPFAEAAKSATLGVAVLGNQLAEKQPGFLPQDCAACTSTLLLAAHGKGLGAVWTGIYPVKKRVIAFSSLWGLPSHLLPFSLVFLGYTNRRVAPREPFSLRGRVWFNQHGFTVPTVLR